MPDVLNITRGDKQILLIDLSGISDDQMVPPLIERAIEIAASGRGPGTLRTLLDLSGTRISGEIRLALSNLSFRNGRYAKATAFVGLGMGWGILLSVFFWARGKRNHKVLKSRNEALFWLEQW